MTNDDLIDAGNCPDRPDLMNLGLKHCWHPIPNQVQISIGYDTIHAVNVRCCFCGCDGVGIPKKIKDPDHGKYDPRTIVVYEYKIKDVVF